MYPYLNSFLDDTVEDDNKRVVHSMTIRQFFNFFGRPDVGQITRPVVNDWREFMRAEGKSPDTVNVYTMYLNSYLQWLFENGHIPTALHGYFDTYKVKRGDFPVPWDKVLDIIEKPLNMDRRIDMKKVRDYRLLSVGVYLGMTSKDITRLEWTHIDIERGELHMEEKSYSKTGKMIIPPPLLSVLDQWYREIFSSMKEKYRGRGQLFPKLSTLESVRYAVQRYIPSRYHARVFFRKSLERRMVEQDIDEEVMEFMYGKRDYESPAQFRAWKREIDRVFSEISLPNVT